MAFTTIPSASITAGKALKTGLFTNIKDNGDNHEFRINALEAGANKVEIFNFEVMGFINHYKASELVQIGTFKAPIDLTITEIGLTLMNGSSTQTSGASGVLGVDIQKSTDAGVTWNTILVDKPEIIDGVSATGSESGIVTFIPSGEDVSLDDLIRVNVNSKKDIQGSFLITVYGDVS